MVRDATDTQGARLSWTVPGEHRPAQHQHRAMKTARPLQPDWSELTECHRQREKQTKKNKITVRYIGQSHVFTHTTEQRTAYNYP